MRFWLAVIILLLAIGGVLATVVFLPPKTAAPSKSVKLPAENIQPTPSASPTEVVTAYLQALQDKDYRKAYDYLSSDSKQVHSFEQFTSLVEKNGVTEFDLSSAKEESDSSRQTNVTLQLKEDPASHSVRLVLEEGDWKVVFIKGIPSFPYPTEG
jgi:hypothetical protein